ncbi:uncharacterized protein BcabD6B2_52000 [Babesia caballi]|uniref:Uncharacterized protein n=1 Tax=Babesia caballi TaxID=5871 RepID=A0AAV4M1K7_BABCB|nr:hypothetical protein BcabD6B2_52000 [Babesia caballi]
MAQHRQQPGLQSADSVQISRQPISQHGERVDVLRAFSFGSLCPPRGPGFCPPLVEAGAAPARAAAPKFRLPPLLCVPDARFAVGHVCAVAPWEQLPVADGGWAQLRSRGRRAFAGESRRRALFASEGVRVPRLAGVHGRGEAVRRGPSLGVGPRAQRLKTPS